MAKKKLTGVQEACGFNQNKEYPSMQESPSKNDQVLWITLECYQQIFTPGFPWFRKAKYPWGGIFRLRKFDWKKNRGANRDKPNRLNTLWVSKTRIKLVRLNFQCPQPAELKARVILLLRKYHMMLRYIYLFKLNLSLPSQGPLNLLIKKNYDFLRTEAYACKISFLYMFPGYVFERKMIAISKYTWFNQVNNLFKIKLFDQFFSWSQIRRIIEQLKDN